MVLFKYEARTSQQRTVKGALKALDEVDLKKKLENSGLDLISTTIIPEETSYSNALLNIAMGVVLLGIPIGGLVYYINYTPTFLPSPFFNKICIALTLLSCIALYSTLRKKESSSPDMSIADRKISMFLAISFSAILVFMTVSAMLFLISERVTHYKGLDYRSDIIVSRIKDKYYRSHRDACIWITKPKVVKSPQLPWYIALPLIESPQKLLKKTAS